MPHSFTPQGAQPTPTATFEIFTSDPSIIENHFPSVRLGMTAVVGMMQGGMTYEEMDQSNQAYAQEQRDLGINRRQARAFERQTDTISGRLTSLGAQLIASYDNLEEGTAAAINIMREHAISDEANPVRQVREFMLPTAPHIRSLRAAAAQTNQELAALQESPPATHYELLKVFAETPMLSEGDTLIDVEAPWLPSQVLVALTALSGSNIKRQLLETLDRGAFDRFIAGDMLRCEGSGGNLQAAVAKLRRLAGFTMAVSTDDAAAQDSPALHQRMVDVLPAWPIAEQQAVAEGREPLANAVSYRFNLATAWLHELDFFTPDLLLRFEERAIALHLKAVPARGVNPKSRISIAGLRARAKKLNTLISAREKERKSAAEASSEAEPEPIKLVTYHLNNDTTTEGIDGLITAFVEKVSQGKDSVTEDLRKIEQYLTNPAKKQTAKRGFKTIQGTRASVTLDGDKKSVTLYELKPADADNSELSLSTVARDCRVLFVKLDDNTLGILDIVPRSDLKETLKYIARRK